MASLVILWRVRTICGGTRSAASERVPFRREACPPAVAEDCEAPKIDVSFGSLQPRDGTALNVVVVVRLAPDLSQELEIDASGRDIERESLGTAINELDNHALEEAMLIKQASGASVSVVALKAKGIEQALRVAFARGADRAVLVDGPTLDPYDTRGAAAALSAAIRQLEADLVLTGVQTPYDLFGPTAPYLASFLGWPHVSVVTQVRPSNGVVRLTQEYSGGRRAILEIKLPAVLGVQAASRPPGYVSMSRLRQAMTGSVVNTMQVATESLPTVSSLIALVRPERRARATMIGGGPAEVASEFLGVLRDRRILEL